MIPRIREIHLQNYRSIAQAVVTLSDLTLLVGPNGSGKSNFVDALAFVEECLSSTVTLAIRRRRGFGAMRRSGAGREESIGIRLVLDLAPDTEADYAFEISAVRKRPRVIRERCVVRRGDSMHSFDVREGEFQEEVPGIRPRLSSDRLVLFAVAEAEEFRPVFDFLADMKVYRIDPARVGSLQEPDPGFDLNADGSNAPAILEEIEDDHPAVYERVCRLLASVVPGVRGVHYERIGDREMVRFDEDNASFPAESMSEGTLRLLGLLLAVYQPAPPAVLIIEEPEVAIHPAAAEVVMSVLLDAAKRMQVVVTTHSPDILDHKALADDSIRVVTKEEGATVISPVSAASRQAIRERLYSPGELLRSDELNPDAGAAAEQAGQFSLFGSTDRITGEAA